MLGTLLVCSLSLSKLTAAPSSILLMDGLVVDGTGKPGRVMDVRVQGTRILEVGQLKPRPNEKQINAKGLVVSPGFIDSHSHTDGSLSNDPRMESQIRQGITTAIVGQDGGSALPITDLFAKVASVKPTLNFATFVGHGTIRRRVMGENFKRAATDREVDRMVELVDAAMRQGSLGLSSGLEYEAGLQSTTFEVIRLSKVAARHGGIYVSHTRSDGGGSNMQSLEELKLIAKAANIPAQNSHIKLAVPDVWGHAPAVLKWFKEARNSGLDLTADVYPYTYWASTITVLLGEEHWGKAQAWETTFKELGGADKVVLARYTPSPEWERKDFAQLSKETGRPAGELAVEVVKKTHTPGSKESEGIICKAMKEQDLVDFIRDPHTMFCSDGSHGGTHPRGAGAFPRIFGVYVRDKRVLSLQEAVRKSTSLPATRFGFKDRGLIRKGYFADLVVFNLAKIRDRSTVANSKEFAEGVSYVMVNGQLVLDQGKMTAARPGVGIRR